MSRRMQFPDSLVTVVRQLNRATLMFMEALPPEQLDELRQALEAGEITLGGDSCCFHLRNDADCLISCYPPGRGPVDLSLRVMTADGYEIAASKAIGACERTRLSRIARTT